MSHHNLLAIDLAKNVFQVCASTAHQKVLFNKQLKRKELLAFMAQQEPTTVVMEACYSSHHWGRHFQSMGHTVKLLPAQHVAPFVRGHKSDKNDALAIAEAALRPNIKSVPVKSLERQDIATLHRLRERHVAQRTALMNQTRGLLSEYGIIAPMGHKAFRVMLQELPSRSDDLSSLLITQFSTIADEYHYHSDRITELDRTLKSIAASNDLCRILLSIPGIGVINATALYSAIGNGNQFNNAREMAVWLGLTPRQSSSGDKFNSGGITKRGNRYLRKQLVHGARAVISRSANRNSQLDTWAKELIIRRGKQKATVAMAARMARLAWVLLHKQELYSAQP